MFSVTSSVSPVVYTFDFPDFNFDGLGDDFDAFQDNIDVRKIGFTFDHVVTK